MALSRSRICRPTSSPAKASCARSTASSFEVEKGKTLGIVGESGCGKSVTALSIMGLLPQPPAKIVGGSVSFEGFDLATLPDKNLEEIRGAEIAMIFQDPMTSLNPTLKIGTQIMETIRRTSGTTRARRASARSSCSKRCSIPNAKDAARRLPAPLLGRDAPARDDRDRDLVQPEAPDRGRADDGARRHRPGGRARPARGAPAGARDGDDRDHARHGSGRRSGRRHRRHVRGPDRGAGDVARPVRPPGASVHRGAAGSAPADRGHGDPRGPADRDPGAAARSLRPARRRAASRPVARSPTARTRARRRSRELREIRPGHCVRSAHPASERAREPVAASP